jgi:predicted metal-dependent HD superfamily phosphohydrolase
VTRHVDGGEPVEDLRQAWLELLETVTTCPQVDATGQALIRSWAEPARRYHTPAHLRDVLDGVNQLAAHATNVTSVRLAAWYHDASARFFRSSSSHVLESRTNEDPKGAGA